MRKHRSITLLVALFVLSVTVGFAYVVVPQVETPTTDGHLPGEGYWEATTLAEARDLAGFMPTPPRALPEGMEVQTIHVTNMNIGGPFIIVDIYLNYPDSDDIGLILSQATKPFSSKGQQATTINGLNYKIGQATDSTPATLNWGQGGYHYELAGYLGDGITEDEIQRIASAMR